jgi:hypothetical protein
MMEMSMEASSAFGPRVSAVKANNREKNQVI